MLITGRTSTKPTIQLLGHSEICHITFTTSMDSPSGIGLAIAETKRSRIPRRRLHIASSGRPGRRGALDAEGELGRALGARRRLDVRRLDRRGARARADGAVLLQLARPDCLPGVDLCHRLVRRVHGLPSLPDARQLPNLSAGSLVARVPGRTLGRRLGAHLGLEPSQAPRVQRQRRRSAFAAPRQMVEPHALVHAELRPALAPCGRREVRARYSQRQDDGGDPLSVPAVAPGDGRDPVPGRLLRHRRSAWAAFGGAARWCSGASACGWCTCCTSPGS